MIALWLCMIPIIWALIARFGFRKSITWKEASLQAGGVAIILVIIYGIMAWSNSSDTLILNGQVTAKEKKSVPCEHSYRCNCYEVCSGSGNSRSCTEYCSTCYDHSNDWDWDVSTTVGNLTIDRIDRRGKDMPPRWAAVKIGEPASRTQSYTNYVKASPNSLFNTKIDKNKQSLIPKYPAVFDYYKVNHTIAVGDPIPNIREWDDLIDDRLRELGPAKQVNIIVVFVTGQGREYANILERAWLGGKKNDVIIVVGVEKENIKWAEAFTFGKTSGNGMLAVQLRDIVQNLETTKNAVNGVNLIANEVAKDFKRKQMKDYEYLKAETGPSTNQTFWLIGVVFVLLGITTFLLWKYDVFDEERFNQYVNVRSIFRKFN